MYNSILRRYNRKKAKERIKIYCGDCLFFNPFGKFCELQILKKDPKDMCNEFEDRRKVLLSTKTLGELPK